MSDDDPYRDPREGQLRQPDPTTPPTDCDELVKVLHTVEAW